MDCRFGFITGKQSRKTESRRPFLLALERNSTNRASQNMQGLKRSKTHGSVRPPASDSFERFWWVSLSRVDDRADEDGLPVSDPEIVDMTDHGSKSCQHRSCTIAPIRN